MAPRKSHHTSVTLFYLALLFAFALVADAGSPQELNHKRLLRKRAPQGIDPAGGLIPGFTPPSHSSVSASSTSNAANTASSGTPTATSVITDPSSTSSSASSTSSSTSLSTSSSSGSSASSGSSSASATSNSATSTSASSLPSSAPTTSDKSTPTSSASDSASTFTQTATLTRTSATPSTQAQGAAANSGPSSSTKKTTTMVIIIIAASVGGVAILWTLFRKWKLGRSSRFDERLQPIDWQPPAGGEGRHRPSSIDSAFRSGGGHGAHGSDTGHASSDHEHTIPEHDFTPLPSNNRLGAVGTYADLTRGPSPLPEMQEAYGPVMTRPAYDVHLPLHHQAGYGAHGHEVYNHTQFNSGPLGY